MGSGCSFSRLASTGCRLKPLPFEGFCFLLFEGFSFLLLEGFSSHAGAENGMPLEGFSFGRLASTEVLRQVGTHAAQGTRWQLSVIFDLDTDVFVLHPHNLFQGLQQIFLWQPGPVQLLCYCCCWFCCCWRHHCCCCRLVLLL